MKTTTYNGSQTIPFHKIGSNECILDESAQRYYTVLLVIIIVSYL